MPGNHNEIERRLWDAADELRANSKLKSSEYSGPVPGWIFLRYAHNTFSTAARKRAGTSSGRRTIGRIECQALLRCIPRLDEIGQSRLAQITGCVPDTYAMCPLQ